MASQRYVKLRSNQLTRYGYDVDMSKIKSPEDFDRLIAHLKEKSWVTSQHLNAVRQAYQARLDSALEEPGYGI